MPCLPPSCCFSQVKFDQVFNARLVRPTFGIVCPCRHVNQIVKLFSRSAQAQASASTSASARASASASALVWLTVDVECMIVDHCPKRCLALPRTAECVTTPPSDSVSVQRDAYLKTSMLCINEPLCFQAQQDTKGCITAVKYLSCSVCSRAGS